MSGEQSIDSASGLVNGISNMFINLSGEYPALLDGLLFVLAAVGFFISSSAVFEVIKMGRRDSVNYSPGAAVWWKMFGGVSLIDLSLWVSVWTSTLWSLESELDISAYSANSNGDYTNAAIMAALGIIVIAGYVVLGRAYLSSTKLGYLTPEARGDVVTGICSRVVAGSIMVASMHFADAINTSAGFNWLPA